MKLKKCLNLVVLLMMVFNLSFSGKNSTPFTYIEYYNKVNKAKEEFGKKEFAKCYEILNQLFAEYEPLNQGIIYEYSLYIKCAVILKKDIDYDLALKKLVKEFGFGKGYFYGQYRDGLLVKALKLSSLKEKDIDKYISEYKSSKNYALRDIIVEMNIRDQLFRGKNDVLYRKKIDSVDSINQKILVQVFEKYGFPNDRLIGNRALKGKPERVLIDALLIHMAGKGKTQYFKKKLLEFVENGQCSPFVYATFVDRECLNLGREQVYYTFIQKGKKLSKKQIENINWNRKNIGLNIIN
ncbi:MAG: hypothetical protein CSA38_03080 [Flavobacteriales bacterium]|nr:MAG: hypothetical protein CSA38_03080 [Flavobacteriales bacterium]